MCDDVCWIYIDVNGEKGPNEFGRDTFSFTLSNNGLLYPDHGKDHALFNAQIELSENNRYWINDSSCNTSSKGSGYGCAARIIENVWKMDY